MIVACATARPVHSVQPLYSGDSVTTCNCDARALPILDDSVHLAVTSPPCNCGVRYDVYDDALPWDDYWHG